jgi:hypothetical protein
MSAPTLEQAGRALCAAKALDAEVLVPCSAASDGAQQRSVNGVAGWYRPQWMNAAASLHELQLQLAALGLITS